ncbi:MAG: hypothetical protein M1431_06340 [Candidatus Thermoplasmatota archaeon]|nr:hypothetical protein [Candidatus Thermoplasmatota archaeon]
MESTTIKVPKQTREKLLRLASKIQIESGKNVTLAQAIEYLLNRNEIDMSKVESVRKQLKGLDLSRDLNKGRREDEQYS